MKLKSLHNWFKIDSFAYLMKMFFSKNANSSFLATVLDD